MKGGVEGSGDGLIAVVDFQGDGEGAFTVVFCTGLAELGGTLVFPGGVRDVPAFFIVLVHSLALPNDRELDPVDGQEFRKGQPQCPGRSNHSTPNALKRTRKP